MEETGIPRESHRPAACHWHTFTHKNVVSSTSCHKWIRTHNDSGDSHWLHSSVLHFCSVIGGCFLLLTFIVCFHFFAVAQVRVINMSLLILLSLIISLSKRDFITIFFKLDFYVDSFAFSTKICLFLSFPQMFMAVLKSNSESLNKGNNKITELQTILQRESQNS